VKDFHDGKQQSDGDRQRPLRQDGGLSPPEPPQREPVRRRGQKHRDEPQDETVRHVFEEFKSSPDLPDHGHPASEELVDAPIETPEGISRISQQFTPDNSSC
jgi:hypothetical protein